MEEQFNGEAKEGRRFAADATRITDETAGSEDRKHTSGGVFVAVDSNLGAVVEEGAIVSIPGNAGRMYVWHSEGQTRGMRPCLSQL